MTNAPGGAAVKKRGQGNRGCIRLNDEYTHVIAVIKRVGNGCIDCESSLNFGIGSLSQDRGCSENKNIGESQDFPEPQA